jgi:hypothetical protein
MATKLPDKEMNELKGKVLIGRVDYLSDELGDPARYFPALRAKGVLFPEDCDRIKAKVTASEKVYEMIELIHTRHSEKDGHAMDVLMEALRKQRVQAHIARELQRALARAKDQRRGEGSASPLAVSPHPVPAATPPQRQSSLTSVTTPMSLLATPATSTGNSLASPQLAFDMHPEFGALPPGRPAKTGPSAPANQSPADVDPVFGMRPGTPPRRQGIFRPTQERASPGLVEVATGMPGLQLHSSASDVMGSMSSTTESFSRYQNGDYHSGSGQPGTDRRYSGLSYTTSGTGYSTSSTEQSGLDYTEAQGEFNRPGSRHKLKDTEAKHDELLSQCQKKDLEMAQLKIENASLRAKYRELEDEYVDLKKQHEQLQEKMRNVKLSEQQHLLESYRPVKGGELDEAAQLRRQVQEKAQQVVALEKQVEQYQKDNQQLQLSLSASGSSIRPHHLPIGSQAAGRPPYTPARSPYQAGPVDTPAQSPFQGGNTTALAGQTMAAGITPVKSMRVGDSLNQHNIHLQQSWGSGSRRDSPAYSPGKDAAPGSGGKRLSSGSGDNPVGESYFQSSNSSLNSSGSKGSAGVTLQTAPNAEHSTMV